MSTDDALSRELADLISRLDPVPADVQRRGVEVRRALADWPSGSGEPLEVTSDTALEPVPVGVRGGARLICFASARHAAVEVEVVPLPGGVFRLVGLVAAGGGAVAGRIHVRHAGRPLTTTLDELGRFAVEPVGRGPVSLVARLPDGTGFTTDWITL